MTLTAAQHAAMEGEAPFPLDELVIVSGHKLAGTRARVYSLLRQTAERGEHHRIGTLIGPAGWVPSYYLRRAWSGGNAGDRRLRDLRELGIRIESMRFSEDSAVVLLRWVSDPAPGSAFGKSGAAAPGQNLFPGLNSPDERVPTASASHRRTSTGRAAHTRFWTCIGHPGSDAPGRVPLVAAGPGTSHPLAISPRLLQAVIVGNTDAEAALSMHDAVVRRRWPELRAWLEAGGEHVLWIEAAAAEALNPLPLLVEILGKCGAEYLGDWNARKKGAA